MQAFVSNPLAPFYCLTKTGLRGFTKALAVTYAKQGIRAVTIHPGNVRSGLVNEDALGNDAIAYMEACAPVGRLGEPEEIAHTAIYAIENEFLTGAELVVDGGYIIQ